MTSLYILIPLFVIGIALAVRGQNPLKYKYLYRNTILSESKKYELSAVLRGRVYYPRYFYLPELKQYFVYSDLDETGPHQVFALDLRRGGVEYVLLDEAGQIQKSFHTPLRFSYRSGCFYGPHTYIPFFETGATDTIPYHKIHNQKFTLNKEDFEKLFVELYKAADYVEYINLRASSDDIHQAAVIFKKQGKVEILLSGLRDSRMSRHFQEDQTTNNFDDYYQPDIRNSELYPASKPSIEMVPLKTNNTDPFVYKRTGLNQEFQMKKYHRTYSSGWQGIMKLYGVPIYVPGEGSGTAYMNFRTKGDVFKIKVLDVMKWDYMPMYNLGLRTFEVPENLRTDNSLVFMESVQNAGGNRQGGGVFVVRKASTDNPSADIPADMTEEHFNTLPLTLQEALLNPDSAKGLILEDKNITQWIPEIERLKNLTHLSINASMTEIPVAIAVFSNLQELTFSYGKIEKVSPKIGELKNLETLDLYANNIKEFPAGILELRKLKILKIGANDISNLPDDINRLENLENLDIIMTKIITLPESMIGMKKLYVRDGEQFKDKLPPAYNHLFEYDKKGLDSESYIGN